MSSNATETLKRFQRSWALARGLRPDDKQYLPKVGLNLFQPMTDSTRLSFEQGSGSELYGRRAKMKALHSSAALAVNFFDFWVERADRSPLQRALQIDREILSVSFEQKYPSGLRGTPPHLDVALELASGASVCIESKFTEWMTYSSSTRGDFRPVYFPEGEGIWHEKGLPATQRLAGKVRDRDLVFHHLDAVQLLKHALGLANQLPGRFSLYYLYFDWPGAESERHKKEISRFADAAGDELDFKVFTFQQLLSVLQQERGSDPDYLAYLDQRYCGNIPRLHTTAE